MDRRERYFDQLEDLLSSPIRQVLVQLIKNCLHNDPSDRPTAEQLVTALEEMKPDVEGAYGRLAKIEAVRQLMTVKAFRENKKANADELRAKDEEIQQLRQLEVCKRLAMHNCILY